MTKSHNVDRRVQVAWILFLAAYPLLDLLTSYMPTFGYLGYAWVVTVLLAVFGCACFYAKRLYVEARDDRSWLTVFVVGAWFLLLGISSAFDVLLSDENIMQVGCPLERFAVDADGGYLSECFIGYPTRSYTLHALPSYLFGFSPFAANIGSVLLFFPGFVFFAYGLRLLTKRYRSSDFVSAVSLALMFQATILLRVIFYHDQTSQPASLALCCFGLVLIAFIERSQAALMVLLSLLVFATSMYPPVLAVLGLTIVVLLWGASSGRVNRESVRPMGISLVVSALAFVQARAYRNDLRLGVSDYEIEHLASRVQALLKFVVLQLGGNQYAGPVLHGILLAVLLLGLFGWWGRYVFALTAWMAITIVCGFFMGGMSPELTWFQMTGMHRSTSIYPVLCAIVAFQASRLLDYRVVSSRVRIAVFAIVLLPAAVSLVRFPYPAEAPLSWRVFRLVKSVVPAGERSAPTFFTRVDFPALGELPRHYYWLDKESTHVYFEKTCVPTDVVSKNSLVVTVDDEVCAKNPPSNDFHLIAQWRHEYLEQWEPRVTTIKVYQYKPPLGG